MTDWGGGVWLFIVRPSDGIVVNVCKGCERGKSEAKVLLSGAASRLKYRAAEDR